MAKWRTTDTAICPTCGQRYRCNTVAARVGNLVRTARAEKGMSQGEFGKLFTPAISHVAVAYLEVGARHIDLDDIQTLSRILDKPVSYFLTAFDEPKP